MNPSQGKKMAMILEVVQNVRRSLDAQNAAGLPGIGSPFGTSFDLDDAIFGILYAEAALVRIWEREKYIRAMPVSQRKNFKVKRIDPYG